MVQGPSTDDPSQGLGYPKGIVQNGRLRFVLACDRGNGYCCERSGPVLEGKWP